MKSKRQKISKKKIKRKKITKKKIQPEITGYSVDLLKITPRNKKYKSNKALINSLKSRCLIPLEALTSFEKVDRIKYMHPEAAEKIGYMDKPSLLGLKQTISAPHMHAYAVKMLMSKLVEGASVLDVGCGSGYLCAIFGYLVGIHKNKGNVVGLDIFDYLVKKSIENISYNNPELVASDRIKIVNSDGWLGYPPKVNKPLYDCIHVGARAEKLPIYLWNQLKEGGLILIPIGTETSSRMALYFKPYNCGEYGYCYDEKSLNVRYVPLQHVSQK